MTFRMAALVSNGEKGNGNRVLELQSPCRGALPMVLPWQEPDAHKPDKDDVDPCFEILETIKLVSSEFPELADLFTDDIETIDTQSWEDMKDIVDRYNAALTRVMACNLDDSAFTRGTVASVPLMQLVMRQVYNLVIDDPTELNDYRGFSEEVYGEFKFPIISDMIEKVPITENDVFIDLGSGVGQIVFQAAGQARCKKCYGIEKRDIPHKYAKSMELAFIDRMKWFGKEYGDFEIIQGDFLDAKNQEIIRKCNIIFCNNYTFPSELNHALKEFFYELEDGTVIISSANLCPLNFRISERNLSDIGAIMTVEKTTFNGEGVSWTDKSIDYYIHRIDRTRLFAFGERKNRGELSAGVSGASDDDDDELSDEEFRPSGSRKKESGRRMDRRGRTKTSRSVSPAVYVSSPKNRSPIARPRKLQQSPQQTSNPPRATTNLRQLSVKTKNTQALTARQQQETERPTLPKYLAKHESSIHQFIKAHDLPAKLEALKQENTELKEKYASLKNGVKTLQKETHRLAHQHLCEALGKPSTSMEWGSIEQVATIANVFVEHERFIATERQLKREIAELEKTGETGNEAADDRRNPSVTAIKTFFKFFGIRLKEFKDKFEFKTDEDEESYQAALRAALQEAGCALERDPKRPRLETSNVP